MQRSWVQFSVPTQWLKTLRDSSPRGPDSLFCLLKALYEHGVHTQMQAKQPHTRSKRKPGNKGNHHTRRAPASLCWQVQPQASPVMWENSPALLRWSPQSFISGRGVVLILGHPNSVLGSLLLLGLTSESCQALRGDDAGMYSWVHGVPTSPQKVPHRPAPEV